MLGDSMITLPPEVAAKVLATLVTENERLTKENEAVGRYRAFENEMLAKAMRAMEEVREIHHWIRKLDGSESCANCGGSYPCYTVKALNQGEDEAPHVDL